MQLKTQLTAWIAASATNKRQRLEFTGSIVSYLQMKRDRRSGALVIVSIEIAPQYRGKGLFTAFLAELQALGQKVIIDCPQPRLTAYCERNGIKYQAC